MWVTRPLARGFDPDRIKDPERSGEVDWALFNANFERFLNTPWWRVNRGYRGPPWLRLLRLGIACAQRQRDAIHDFAGKTAALARLRVPPDPSIVFFGAEAGWEAAILQAIFGAGGEVVLIDEDPAAHDRFLHAPVSVRVRAPRRSGRPELLVKRDLDRWRYLRQNFFDVTPEPRFDVGIDWGLIEHFPDPGKANLIAHFRKFLKPGGLQISSSPRDRLAVRLFYRAFANELNTGYRELMTLPELTECIEEAGGVIEHRLTLPAHNIVAYR
ncbi:MAG: class I SAM-dependent methyltransferase [Acidobacteriota bacterium]|nr:class I SAM-dependent methyltransferase [Acidobacteriota bacterium]